MPNPHSKWRTAFARRLTRKITAFNGVRAVVVAGSVARGFADEYSDIEIPIFWETLPDDETRLALAAGLNAGFLFAYDGPACEDQLLIGNVQVDLWHIAVAHQEETIRAVLRGESTDLGSLNALDTVRACIPLHGHAIVAGWKRLAREYPDALALQIIAEHLPNFSMGELFILAQRDNPTAFHARLSYLQQEIFLVLLALNRRYFPTFKWLYRTLASLKVKPQEIDRRFRQAYKASYADAIADTRRLLVETLGLAQGRFPQLDTSLVHRHLAYERIAHPIPVKLRDA